MADPVGSLKQIVEVALKIKEAAETVRQNKEDCLRIGRRVERARLSLSLCENNAELMKEAAAIAALEALGEILGEALRLVTACQERSFMCLCWEAGKLSKQLSKVDQAISSTHSEATFAILVYLISKQNKDGAHPPPPSLERPLTPTPEPELCPPPLKPEPEPELWLLPRVRILCAVPDPEPPPPLEPEPEPEPELCPPPPEPPSAPTPAPVVRIRIPSPRADHLPSSLADQAEERNLLPEIGRVALEIKEAVQTVRQNKEECIEIDKRVNRVNDLLSRFENTETMKDPEMSAQLEKLLKTFRHAHTLVTACQRRNITIILPAGRLTKQLREVLDQTELTLDQMIAISVRCAGTVSESLTPSAPQGGVAMGLVASSLPPNASQCER